MPKVENSEVVRHVLETLVDISGRKTTQIQAVSTLSELIKKLEGKYDFLKHVEIKDIILEKQKKIIGTEGAVLLSKG